MKTILKFLFSFVLVIFISFSHAQNNDSCRLRISVLTCAPGNELYALFGHSAVRVIDSSRGSDVVFNYGTFDFSDPDFYSKFIRGKLNYFLAAENYPNFLMLYQYEQRSIVEQELSLNCAEKNNFYRALLINIQEENKYYKYDFLFDNCTSRIRDLLNKHVDGFTVQRKFKLLPTQTFRDMLHEYLNKGGQPWSKFGIDLLLGSKIDRPVTQYESMFLPDYLMKGVDNAIEKDNKPVVAQKQTLFSAIPAVSNTSLSQPLILFTVISSILFLISLLKQKWAIVFTQISDSLLLYITGLIGIFLLFMWFGTDHVVCGNNYNLLWALPTNFIAAFFIWKKPLWIRPYFLVASLIYTITLICFFFLPQQLNVAVIPVIALMAVRCFRLNV